MNQVSHLLLIIFTVSALAACKGSGGLSTNPADIQGEWELASVNGNDIEAAQEDGAYTLAFNPDSTIAGRADCNYYTGQYSASETEEQGKLDLESVSTTKIDCGQNSQYKTFVKSVLNAESFQVEGGNQLVLSGGDQKVIFNRTEEVETEETEQGQEGEQQQDGQDGQ